MEPSDAKTPRRSRLTPDDRRAQLVSHAARAALDRGNLPIALADLAEAAGASKALIYAYFPTQHDLFNAVLAADFEALDRAGIMRAASADDLDTAAAACAAIYFEHIVARGPVAHLILRDPFMRGRISPRNRAFRDRVAGRLAGATRRRFQIPPKIALAAFNLAVVIPEEAGLLVRAGDTHHEVGQELVAQLMQSTLAALAAEAAPRVAYSALPGR